MLPHEGHLIGELIPRPTLLNQHSFGNGAGRRDRKDQHLFTEAYPFSEGRMFEAVANWLYTDPQADELRRGTQSAFGKQRSDFWASRPCPPFRSWLPDVDLAKANRHPPRTTPTPRRSSTRLKPAPSSGTRTGPNGTQPGQLTRTRWSQLLPKVSAWSHSQTIQVSFQAG